MIRVLYYAGVRQKAGTSETRVEGFSGTLLGLVRRLEERHGICLLNPSEHEESDLLSVFIIMINGRHIAHLGGLDSPVSEGDVVTVFPVVGGG